MGAKWTDLVTGLTSAVALVVSTSAQAAPVKECVTTDEIHGLVAFVLPQIADQVVTKCSTTLRPNGYFNSRGIELVQRLSQGKEAGWPMARRAFRKMSDEAKDKAFASLSDATVRALVENELVGKLMSDVSVTMCRDIESVVETLDPLSGANMVQFVSAIFGVAGRNGSTMKACPPK
jgi:hypothetical protein